MCDFLLEVPWNSYGLSHSAPIATQILCKMAKERLPIAGAIRCGNRPVAESFHLKQCAALYINGIPIRSVTCFDLHVFHRFSTFYGYPWISRTTCTTAHTLEIRTKRRKTIIQFINTAHNVNLLSP